MFGGLAQMRLEFAEGQLDRVKVRRILRKIDERRANRFYRLCDTGDLVDRQMVHEHDLTTLEGWYQTLPDIDEKHGSVHGAPSVTNGAVIPRCRRPPTKVMVFQAPCGA